MMQESLEEFKAHNQIVSQYGRDPCRNAILKREATQAEEEFLQQFQAGTVVTDDER